MTTIPDAAIAVIAAARCAGCRRRLKHPTPSGYGPVCARKRAQSLSAGRGGVPGPMVPPGLSQALTARNTPPHCDGQDELPLNDQPALWSI